MNFKPTMYVKDIFSINYQLLKSKKIKCLMFDIDNTIAEVSEKYPSKKVQELFNKLKKDFRVIIISNALKRRADRFKNSLNVDCFSFACKPLKRSYNKILDTYAYEKEEVIAIGDQLYTDIKGAAKMGIKCILVDPISKKEGIITKYNRLREKRLINRKKVIRVGEYYE